MYEALYEYLLHYKRLALPGIGQFLLVRDPGVIDFPARKMYAPEYRIAMEQDVVSPSKIFFSWLGSALNTTDREAIRRFNDFVFDLKEQINAGHSIRWNGVGVLNKGLGGGIKFESEPIVLEEPVRAEKVIREKAMHTVRVGEEERSSEEMQTLLTQPEEKKSYNWIYVAAVGLVAVLFIGWYFSEHGVAIASTANNKKIKPAEAHSTYKSLQP